MRQRALIFYWAFITSGSLIAFVSCDDTSSHSPPQEYDPQIDSVASAPLPTIVVGMSEGTSSESDGSGRGTPPPGVYEAEEPLEPVVPLGPVSGEPPPVRNIPVDPNAF